MIISIAVSLVVIPLFATIDFENRFHYCLRSFQRMYYLIIQAFLSEDPIMAKIFLSRASIMEERIRQTLTSVPNRLIESQYEPSRLLQKIFFRRRRHMIDLSIEGLSHELRFHQINDLFLEESNLLSSLMFHASSLQLMIHQCQFNAYHHAVRSELESSLIYLNSCQSSLISSITSKGKVSKEKFQYCLTNIDTAVNFVRLSYKRVHLNQLKTLINSEDHLSHAFFLFQIFTIIQLLMKSTRNNVPPTRRKENKRICWQMQRSRILLSIKSMVVIGVGSIFVMVPFLAKVFENGQWILIALCMTQAETVGGALTTMKMRLIGTLLGEEKVFFSNRR